MTFHGHWRGSWQPSPSQLLQALLYLPHTWRISSHTREKSQK